jgi:uncharacterized RmlC-like cupin family protein
MTESARLQNLGGVVRAGQSYQGKQGPDYIPGVSAQTVGSQALWLGSVTLPPHGGRTKPISTRTTSRPSTCSAARMWKCLRAGS